MSKKIPNISDPPQPKKKPKVKKPLRTPSHILRVSLIWCFVVITYLLSFSYITATLYITEDLQITNNPEEAYLTYSDQEQINQAAENLSSAIDNLKKKNSKETSGEQSESSENSFSLNSANYEWTYHIAEGIDCQKLVGLIDKARATDKSLYTDESIKALNTATLQAQKSLIATVTISKSPFELMFGGSTQSVGVGNLGINSIFLVYALAVFPLIGFFTALFDKHLHVKFISAILCSVFAVTDIFMTIYPYVAIGAVLSIFLYILAFILGLCGLYALQQENYIIRNPELEPEFTEKHPYFVRALINYKSFSKQPVLSDKQKEKQSAKNAQKKRNKKN